MPKTPSNKLFDLIKSLSGSEKRYFKLFIRERDERSNKYLRLFDAIDQQSEFNEESLKDYVYGGEEIESRKYSELKAYLYDLILKSLQSFDSKNSAQAKIKSQLLGIEALCKRSRFQDAKQLLHKAAKQAKKYEYWNLLLEIFDWEKKIAYAQTQIAYLNRELPRIEEQERDALQQLQWIAEYQNLFFRLLVSLRLDASQRDDSIRAFRESLDAHPLLVSCPVQASHSVQILYLRIKAVVAYAKGNTQTFYETSKACIAQMESQAHFLKEDVSQYISALSNLVVSCGQLKKYEEVEHCLNKFLEIKPITKDDELKIHRQYFMNRFALCIRQGDFIEGQAAMVRHEEALARFNRYSFQKNTFYFQYFYISFGSGDYESAVSHLNEWLSLGSNEERQDLQSLSRILNLIIHYEMDNTLLLESLVRSAYRYQKKQKMVYEYERLMLQFFRQSNKVASKRELKQAFQGLRSSLEDLFVQPRERAMLQLFDVLAWVDSKILQVPFPEVVQRKFAQERSAKTEA